MPGDRGRDKGKAGWGWGRGKGQADEPVREEEAEPNAYDVLEVAPTASQDELKKAYRKAAVKWHPDKAKTDKQRVEFTEKLKAINNAYDKVKDEDKRRMYDIMQRYGGGPWRGPDAHWAEAERRRREAEAKRTRDDEWRARGDAAERERQARASREQKEREQAEAEERVRKAEEAERVRQEEIKAARARVEEALRQRDEADAKRRAGLRETERWAEDWFTELRKTLAEALQRGESTTIFEQLKLAELKQRTSEATFPMQFKAVVEEVKKAEFLLWSEDWFSKLPKRLREKQTDAAKAQAEFLKRLQLLPLAEQPKAQERLRAILEHEQKLIFNQKAEKWFTDFTGELAAAIRRGSSDLPYIIQFKRAEFEAMLNDIPPAERPQHRLRFEFLIGH